MLTETSLHVQGENSCLGLHLLGSVATKLCCYLVEGSVYLFGCRSSSVGHDKQDENPFLGRLLPDMMMMARELLSLLERVVAGEVDLVVGVRI